MKAKVARLLAAVGRLTVERYRDAARKGGDRFIRHYGFPDAIGVGVRSRSPHLRASTSTLRNKS